MKNQIAILICLLILLSSCSRQPIKHIAPVSYRGWDNCLRMSNETVSIIINPTYGGQILYFGLDSRGENILWSDSVINGWTVADYTKTRRSPDAGRFDIGYERKTAGIHDSIWAGPYTSVIESDNKIRLVSTRSAAMGIQVERIYTLKNHQPVLHIEQHMTNISDSILEYCFWTRTLLPAGGTYFCELTPCASHPTGYSEISLSADTLIPAENDLKRIFVNKHNFVAFPGGDNERKYGINTTSGTCSYLHNQILYTKQTKYDPIGLYNNNNKIDFPNMIYFNSHFLEMEPNSPMIRLSPGETYSFSEIWRLTDLANSKKRL